MIKVIALSSFMFMLIGSSKRPKQDPNWVAPKYANDIKNPHRGDEKATAQGKKLFNNMCAICHGKKGKGNGVAGVSLIPRPANFLAIDVKKETDGAIFWKMTEGKPPMASYKEILTDDQRWDLVCYIRQLQKNN